MPLTTPVTVVESVMAGVVVAVATVPARPFAETTDTLVTVPPEPVADNVPPTNETPVPMVTLAKPPKLSPYKIEVPLVAGA